MLILIPFADHCKLAPMKIRRLVMTCPVEVPSIPLAIVQLRYRDPDDSDAALPISAVELAITSFFPLGPIACNVDGPDHGHAGPSAGW